MKPLSGVFREKQLRNKLFSGSQAAYGSSVMKEDTTVTTPVFQHILNLEGYPSGEGDGLLNR